MSTCRIQKYKAGGRCGGDQSGGQSKNGSLSNEFASLLNARSSQDAMFSQAPQAQAEAHVQQKQQKQQQLVVRQSTKNTLSTDVDTILAGDYE